jgi:hypothetical protein
MEPAVAADESVSLNGKKRKYHNVLHMAGYIVLQITNIEK